MFSVVLIRMSMPFGCIQLKPCLAFHTVCRSQRPASYSRLSHTSSGNILRCQAELVLIKIKEGRKHPPKAFSSAAYRWSRPRTPDAGKRRAHPSNGRPRRP